MTIECDRLGERVARLEAQLDGLVTTLHREHDKFEEFVSKRFDNVNELRGALEDLGKTMATRRELEAAVENTKTEIVQGSRDMVSRVGLAIAILSLAVIIAVHLLG